MGLLQAMGHQLGGIWRGLSAGHRVILLLLCALCAGGLVAVVLYAGAPDYQILYTDLSAKACAELVAALKDAGIPARVAEGGTAVMVPAGKMNAARMAAAEKGVPQGGRGGFEAFRDPKIGITPFAERVNYVSALQNELATTIMSLDSVMYARVHLAIPERTLFAKDQKSPSASVLVVTHGNRSLSSGQASAIANLVSSAVEGFSPEAVTITDGQGNVLAGAGEEDYQMAADDQFIYRQRVEAYLGAKAETMLAKVLGPGRAEVRVGVELAFQDSRETTREYDPDKRVVVSERIESTKSTGRGTEVGGVVGSAGNIPGQGPAARSAGPGPASESESENIDTQYVVSESVRETVNRGATIQRISAAAFVDLAALNETDQAEGAEGAAPPAAAITIEDVSRIIKDALGFDESRGDRLEIVEASLRPAMAAFGGEAPGMLPPWAAGVGQYFAVGVLGLVLLVIARRIMGNIQSAAPRRVIVPEIMGQQEGEGTQRLGMSEDELIRREIAKFVQGRPEVAGRLLEGWVEGEE